MLDVTDDERKFLGFHLACQLEDYGKMIKKQRNSDGHEFRQEQWNRLEQIIYTKVIPEAWHGPKPSYWKE